MPDSILAIRIHAGFNASSFTAGLLALTEQTSGTAGAYLRSLFPGLDIGLELKPAWVRGISGWTVKFLTPAETGQVTGIPKTSKPFTPRAVSPRAPGSVPELFGTNSCAPKLECTALRKMKFTSMKSAA